MAGLIVAAKDFFKALGEEPRLVLVIIEVLFILVAGVLESIYQIYAAMAIGQLADKHRLIASLGAYIGIDVVLTSLASALFVIVDLTCMDAWLRDWLTSIEASVGMNSDGFILVQAGLGIASVVIAVQLVAFHITAERILSKKLNLL